MKVTPPLTEPVKKRINLYDNYPAPNTRKMHRKQLMRQQKARVSIKMFENQALFILLGMAKPEPADYSELRIGTRHAFESTTAWGATMGKIHKMRMKRFQSTLPRAERRQRRHKEPRTRGISIHAPAWGATTVCSASFQPGRFQSTLPRGERPASGRRSSMAQIFQSTLPRGERLTSGW